jgi:hypothetical protein
LIKYKYGCGPHSAELGEAIIKHDNDSKCDENGKANEQKDRQSHSNLANNSACLVPQWFKKRSNDESLPKINSKTFESATKKPKFNI